MQVVTTQWFICTFLHVLLSSCHKAYAFFVSRVDCAQRGENAGRDVLLGACAAIFRAVNPRLSSDVVVEMAQMRCRRSKVFCRSGIVEARDEEDEERRQGNAGNPSFDALSGNADRSAVLDVDHARVRCPRRERSCKRAAGWHWGRKGA